MRVVLRCALGLALFSAPVAALAQTSDPQPQTARSAKIPAPLPPDVEFARSLALLRADLLMADALVKERDWVDAQPHAAFPREEIYGVIRPDLRRYKVPPFDDALRALAHATHARSVRSYERALGKVQVSLAAADKTLRARQPDWPRFTLQTAVATLSRAAEEYDDAVANGRVVHPIGYQSARGIVLEVKRMIDGVGGALAAKNAQAMQELRGGLLQLEQAFAPLAPPQPPPMQPAAVKNLIAAIDKAARELM